MRLHTFTLAVLGVSLASLAVACGGENSGASSPTESDSGGPPGMTMGTDSGSPVHPNDSGTTADSGGSTGDSGGATDSGGSNDAGSDAAADGGDHGSPSNMYPAFTPDVAQVVDNGGPTLANPVVVTITWSSDPDVAKYEAFGDNIGPTNYWKAISSEYGIGAVVSDAPNHVHITTAAPTTMSDQDLVNFVTTNVGSATSGWPAPSNLGTIYAIYMAPTTGLTFGGQNACQQGVGGYHDEVSVGGKTVSYAVMPHCPGFSSDDVTTSASHELLEAASDPFPQSKTAYAGFDPNHLSYEFFNAFQDELGDACEIFKTAYYTDNEPNFMYAVQRQWSNLSAKAGHNPCVPLLGEPFYSVTLFPDQEDTISANFSSLGFGTIQSKGFKVPLNQSRTFQVGFFSDQATSGPWSITASVDAQFTFPDNNGNPINNGTATVTIDKMMGVNGEKAYVTVTPTMYSSLGVVFLYITSVLPGAQAHHYAPILISAM